MEIRERSGREGKKREYRLSRLLFSRWIVVSILIVVGAAYLFFEDTPSLVNPVTGQIDVQYNFFSAGPNGSGVGAVSPYQTSLPYGSFPANGIFDPSDSRSTVALGSNASDPSKYDAILKLADGIHDLTLAHVRVAQGIEDSLNLNNAVANVKIAGDFAVSGAPGLRVITIKGGSHDIVISGTLHGHGTSEDIKIGDWSDQSYALSSNIDISGLHEADGSNIKVIIGHASNIVLNSSEVVHHIASAALTTYWQLKYYIRRLLGIPIGKAGPSWMS